MHRLSSESFQPLLNNQECQYTWSDSLPCNVDNYFELVGQIGCRPQKQDMLDDWLKFRACFSMLVLKQFVGEIIFCWLFPVQTKMLWVGCTRGIGTSVIQGSDIIVLVHGFLLRFIQPQNPPVFMLLYLLVAWSIDSCHSRWNCALCNDKTCLSFCNSHYHYIYSCAMVCNMKYHDWLLWTICIVEGLWWQQISLLLFHVLYCFSWFTLGILVKQM